MLAPVFLKRKIALPKAAITRLETVQNTFSNGRQQSIVWLNVMA
jgi:hypothetical protein